MIQLNIVFSVFYIMCRDGVSESQFNQVLNIELDRIIEVLMLVNCAFLVLIISHRELIFKILGLQISR